MISTRYVIPVIILLALALIPTIIHSYIGATDHDGKSVQNIPFTLNNFTSTPAKRNAQWGEDMFGSTDWFERNYQNRQHTNIRLFVARAYDHKRLYHHPELALSYAQNLGKKEILQLPKHPEIPVHVFNKEDHSMRVAYVLLYDGQFIQNPIAHQISTSLNLLVNARKPMTIFYASQSGSSANTTFDQSAIADLLSQAIKSFQAQTKAISLEPTT
ncbi:exosortase-associated EpsI family protein [methanotrophic endosymbiont of Bathymodiolus puteoserpentis (Logatchev)]|jgi:hypothetical protein|uniref:exosortase-associated EpsI family protein n=1 Tax=methanotrophic endosymbiont of Bathymodiolus puteoserpentis (Logatchev) TaxID=343235 RepID=UPI0013C757B2|nr:exosortase-associated EpsI family protein [methanotrophic endosymbiont of Bathymodiolus puteoserpentis (Logatchev)]SHE23220.1 hypothetical protein BPUTEOMOX_1515 [methanotrophic endosymbiont of Bathymodiolus puteoserpentis (Logatchev)]